MPAPALAGIAAPIVVGDRVVARTFYDLTVYLEGPSVDELAWLVDHYERLCPPALRRLYCTTECPLWFPVDRPELTRSGREARALGVARPFLEPTRRRIGDGRAFDFQLWDGVELADPAASWTFSIHRIHRRDSGLHGFARILMPLDEDPQRLLESLRAIADNVAFRSAHGGPILLYDPREQGPALDAAYALARRFWGLDLEDLNDTLPMTVDHIKGVNWLTAVGSRLRARPEVADRLSGLAHGTSVRMERFRHGIVLVAGDAPVAGDQNRQAGDLAPYLSVAHALRSLFIDRYPDFPSERFRANGNTLGWFRRLIEPKAWR